MYTTIFGVLVIGLIGIQYQTWSSSNIEYTPSFKKFQMNYLIVYYIMMFADWLQGAYVYALYTHYKFSMSQIAQLFIAGFMSSMVFGTFVGSIADKYGRKKLALAFGAFYSVACITKLYPNFSVLMLGRILSGVATSLLFSVFESWMVYEHKNRKFASDWISDTFSKAIFGNGIVAIISGLVSSWAVDAWGYVSPFMISLVSLIIGTVIVLLTWNENFGDASIDVKEGFENAIKVLKTDKQVFILGWVQSLFEAAMYIFVFMWSPALDNGVDPIPFGLVFACFMVAIMIGSSVFGVLMRTMNVRDIAMYNVGLAGISLLLCAFTNSAVVYMMLFVLFEFCCGIYFPSIGTLRSSIIPEETRSAIMNFFRIPLNFLVVVALIKVSDVPESAVFGFCGLCLGVSSYLLTKVSVVERHDVDEEELSLMNDE